MNVFIGLVVSAATLFINVNDWQRTRDIEQRVIVDPSHRVEIQGFPGSKINFSSWDSSTIYINLKLRIESSSQEYEERWINGVRIAERRTSSGVVLTFEEPDFRGNSGQSFWSKLFGTRYVSREISGEIILPRSNPTRVNMPYANVVLENMKGELEFKGESNTLVFRNCAALSNIDNNFGKTTIENSGGNLRLKSESGTLTMKEFEGSVNANIKYTNGTFERIAKDVTVESESATLKFENIGGNLSVDANFSKITATSIAGVVDMKNESGTITLKTAKAATIDGKYTNMDVSDIGADSRTHPILKIPANGVSVLSESSKLKFENIGGDLSVRANYANISAVSVSGFVDVWDEGGTVKVQTAKGVKVEGKYTKVEIADISGESKKDIVLMNESGNITLENVVGNVHVDDNYGTIKLKKIRGNIKVISESGNVTAEEVTGNWSSEAPYTNITLRNYSAQTVNMVNSSGTIDVELKTVPTSVNIKNQYSGVKVVMPKGFSGSVTLEATYAQVESNLPIRVKSLGGGAYGAGSVGSGNGSIAIETESGNIQLFER